MLTFGLRDLGESFQRPDEATFFLDHILCVYIPLKAPIRMLKVDRSNIISFPRAPRNSRKYYNIK